jgi:hypothetical protein
MLNSKGIFVMVTCAVAAFFSVAAYGQEFDYNYISWGVDEFELFGLTKTELAQQFKNKLTFDWTNSRAYVGHSLSSPRLFILTLKDKRVSEVQRVVRDPAGCNLEGPLFTSKEAALRFAINGLSELGKLRPEEENKHAVAKQTLIEIERGKIQKSR